jgi:hypothetical protein
MWRVVIALVMVLSLGLVMAVPAAASPAVQAVYLSPQGVALQTEANGTAERSATTAHAGSYSAKLGLPQTYSSSDVARFVQPLTGLTLSDITSLSYWYYADSTATSGVYKGFIKEETFAEPSGGGYATYNTYGAPYLVIALDADLNGSADTWVIQAKWAATYNKTWKQDTIEDTEPFHVAGIVTTPPFDIGTNWGSLSEIKTATVTIGGSTYTLGNAAVLQVKVAIGEWNPVGPTPPNGPVVSYVDDITINTTTYDLLEQRFGTPDAPIMPDANGRTVSLDAGSTYDLHLLGFPSATTVYLDDIGYDTIEPADSDATSDAHTYAESNDATSIVLTTGGTGVFYGVQPLYASLLPSNYLGLKWGATEGKMNVIASAYEGVAVSSTATSFEINEAQTFTATVTKDGAGLSGAKVEVWLDSNMDGIGDTSLATGFTTSSGQKTFTITPAKAGQIILQVTKDIGGTLHTFLPDGITDIDNLTCKTVINPATYLVSTTPTTLYKNWTYAANTIVVTVKDALGLVKNTGIKYSASGCGITPIVKTVVTTDATGTFKIAEELTPTTTGTITLTVSRYLDGDDVADYTGTASITVTTAAKFNVDISPTEIPAATGTGVTASFWDVNMKGPDSTGSTSLLNNVKVTLSGVGVSATQTINNAASYTFAGVTPEQAGTITATFVGTFDDTTVETKTLDISVTGYKVVDLVPSTDQVIDATSDISMTVTTKAGAAVNNANVTITAAQAVGFKKDVNPAAPGLESFQTIVINGAAGTITYDGGSPEPFLVNNGFYKVTGIKFAKVGAVKVEVKDGSDNVKANFPKAFTVLGADVYTLSDFVPTKLTAGVDAASLKVTVKEGGVAVTNVATITISGMASSPFDVSAQHPADGVYTINPDLVSEAKTLTVTAKNADVTKWGSATLEVALPAVSYVIKDASEIQRTLMLTGQAYTVTATVTDALGQALANGKVSLGSYAGTTFTPLGGIGMPVTLDATGQKAIAITAADGDAVTAGNNPGTLVWKVGDATNAGPALVLVPAISVQALYYDVNPKAATVGVETTYTVKDNYLDVAGNRDVKIVTPGGDVVNKVTTPVGTFKYTAPAAGDYYVSVKLDGTWQAPITVTVSVPVKTLESISAVPESVSLNVGGTQQLTVTATYSDATTANVTATASYVSSVSSVATVSNAGLITAVAEGSATITVSYTEGGVTKTDIVSVTVSAADILAYYRAYSGDPTKVETADLLKAANDWANEVVPPGFTEPISTTQLLTLANEWAATE